MLMMPKLFCQALRGHRAVFEKYFGSQPPSEPAMELCLGLAGSLHSKSFALEVEERKGEKIPSVHHANSF